MRTKRAFKMKWKQNFSSFLKDYHWNKYLEGDSPTLNLLSNRMKTRICVFVVQKQPSIGVLKKRCSENIQQNYRRTPMSKRDFNNAAKQLRHRCSPVNLLHIFRTPLLKNTYARLLLVVSDFLNLLCQTSWFPSG